MIKFHKFLKIGGGDLKILFLRVFWDLITHFFFSFGNTMN